MTSPVKGTSSTSRTLLVAIIISVIAGGITGFATSYAVVAQRPAPQDRTFFLFTTVLGFDEHNASIAFGREILHDYFAPDRITVNRGDRVTVRYYNTEDQPENHTFTMGYSTYSFDYLLQYQQEKDIAFTADLEGVFTFRCTIHQPTMTGYLVVLG